LRETRLAAPALGPGNFGGRRPPGCGSCNAAPSNSITYSMRAWHPGGRGLEAENVRLKKLLAEAELDKAMLKELAEGNF
jgi:putative transposase